MKIINLIFLALILLTLNLEAKKVFICSIHPAASILKELTGTAAEVKTLATIGASPHSYSLKPSDLVKVNVSDGLFYIGGKLDPWAEAIETEKKFALLELMPKEALLRFNKSHEHNHDDVSSHEDHSSDDENELMNIDPHFWLDPMTVLQLIQPLKEKLSELDPDNANIYNSNATAFENKLKLTHSKIDKMMMKFRGKPVFQFHQSFNYFIKRYRLTNAGVIQKVPGTNPTVKETADLIMLITKSGAKSIFTEPQLPKKPAEIISKEAGVSLFELDPVGGTKGRERYTDLLMYNAEIFKKAL